jgi:TBC1 domain family member 10
MYLILFVFSPILFASEWFTTIFGYNFDVAFTSRIWTLVLSVGKLYLFRVAMALLKMQEKELLKMQFEGIN